MERIAILDRVQTGYDEDVAAWADAQVELLRAGRLDIADLSNIIEEIESVAASQRIALSSQVGRVIEHLRKLIRSPATDPRGGWRDSIRDARSEIDRILSDSPSLRSSVPDIIAWNLPRVVRLTAAKLADHGELDRVRERAMLAQVFTVDQVVDDWFPPEA